jgi:Uma2 family endonuclease
MNQHFRPSEPPATTQAAEGLPRRAWTVAEIEDMVRLEILQEDDRFELIGGEIVPMSPKGSKHEHYKISLLNYWIKRASETYRIAPETTLRFDDHAFFEPDFIFYDATILSTQISIAHTLLAVEVADSSLLYDKNRKSRIYSNYGLKTLWVIDVNTLDTHVFSEPGINGYQLKSVVGPDEILAPAFAPELALKLSELPLI